jgi:UDP-glucose 4-epimerase
MKMLNQGLGNNILITGTSGFIGNYIKVYLKSEEFGIWGTVRSTIPLYDEFKLDLTKWSDYEKLPRNSFEIIIHSAGVVPSKKHNYRRKKYYEINAKATKKLLIWAKNNGCKHFIHLSSIAAYGLKTLGEYRTESNTRRSEGIFGPSYNCSKAKAEKYIEKSGLNYTILRLPSVLGSNDTVISPSIIPLLTKGEFFYTRKKDPLFSTLYIKNLGPIVKKIIENGPLNDVFNCTDHHITWSEFVEEFARILRIEPKMKKKTLLSILTHLKDKNFLYVLTNSYFGAHFPNKKLSEQFNFKPIYSWKEGVKESIASFLG